MGLHTRLAFAERDNYDDLSSSFRSLYKSIFGHSVQSGGYFNELPPTSQGMVSDVSTSSGDLGLSNTSLPLGASANALFSSVRNPQFTSLMDSFRDIADTNSWDKLDPAQIQGLMDSFKSGEHDKFGLEPELYAELHTSFNHFLSQLNNRFLTGSSNTTPQLSEYNHHHHPGVVNSGHMSKYISHHQLEMVSPLVHHQASPPPPAYHANRTPSPHSHTTPPQGQLPSMPVGSNPVGHQYGVYPNTNHTPPLASVTPPTGTQAGVAIRSAATDLFDDDDDFDWSRLM